MLQFFRGKTDSPLHDAPYIFYRRQMWTAGRPVKHTHCVCMKPRCWKSCRMRSGIVLLKINTDLPEKDVTSMVAYVSPKLQHPSLHQWSLHTYEVIHAVDTDAPILSHTLALNLSLITAWMLYLIFVEADVSFSQKQLKCGLI